MKRGFPPFCHPGRELGPVAAVGVIAAGMVMAAGG